MENNNNTNTNDNNQQNNNEGNQNNNVNDNQQNNQQSSNTGNNGAGQQTMTKEQIISEYVKGLGLNEGDDIADIVKKHNEDVQNNKTDLQKAQDEKSEALKKYIAEKNRADLAEAKLFAISMGVKKELVDDVVAIAQSKMVDGKKISEIITEIKESDRGSFYFPTDEDEKQGGTGQTRGRAGRQNNNNSGNNNQNNGKTSIANRLFEKKKKTQSYYFK